MKSRTLTDYNENADDYDRFRRPSPIILDKLRNKFSISESQILSMGCGTGRYEALLGQKIPVVGIDLSFGMLSHANNRISDVALADILALPFPDNTFSGAYFMQSLHHIGANLKISPAEREWKRIQALREAMRVIDRGPLVIVQRDPTQNQAVWFWKYFPKALETKLVIQPKVSSIKDWLAHLGLHEVMAEPINDPMSLKFFQPESPLDPGFQKSFSEFSYLSKAEKEEGIAALRRAVEDGTALLDIESSKEKFRKIGGTVFMITAKKV